MDATRYTVLLLYALRHDRRPISGSGMDAPRRLRHISNYSRLTPINRRRPKSSTRHVVSRDRRASHDDGISMHRATARRVAPERVVGGIYGD
jgi:hypothetical protein